MVQEVQTLEVASVTVRISGTTDFTFLVPVNQLAKYDEQGSK
jgi:hypothetical protein